MDELDKRDREIYMQRNIADVAATPIGTPGDELSEEEQVTEAALMADASFARNSRIVYQFIHGKPFEGSDVEAGRYGIDAIGEVYWNLTGERTGGAAVPLMRDAEETTAQEKYLGAMPMFYKLADTGTPEQAAAVANMIGQYDRLPNNTSRGWFRAIRGVMHDYLTYSGLGFVGARGAANMSGRETAKKMFNDLATSLVENRFKAASVAGAGYTAAYDVGQQMTEIKGEAADPSLGMSPEARAARTGIATTTGAALGPAIAVAGEGAIRGAGAMARDVARRQRSPEAELGAIGPEVQAKIDPVRVIDRQSEEVRNAIKADAETNALVRQLAGEKRSTQSIDEELDDYDIVTGDELLRELEKAQKKIPTRKQDELGFYSRAQEFIDNLKQEKLTGPQLKGQMLNAGVKADELKWTGLDEFLEANPKLTKQEAMDFIDQNKVKLEEITYEGGTLNPDTHQSFSNAEVIDDYDAINFQRELIDEDINGGDDDYLELALENRGYDVTSGLAAYKELMRATGGRYLNVEPEVLAPIQSKYPDVDVKNIGWEVDAELTEIARENYFNNPYYEVNGEGMLEDYRIVGNDDTGYYVTYEGEGVTDISDVYSLNEAQVQVQQDAIDRGLDTGAGDTQYSEYTQEGAENYREVLLTNPSYKGDPSFKLNEAQEARFKELGDKIEAEKERRPQSSFSQVYLSPFDALSSSDAYEFEWLQKQYRLSKVMESRMPSPHWQEDDVVAHARLSDREARDSFTHSSGARADGKVLYIEELQSDWAQTGRRAGFGAKEKKFEIAEAKEPQTGKSYFVVYDIEGYEKLSDIPIDKLKAPITFARGEKQFATRKQAEEAIEYEKKMMPKRIGTPEGPLVGSTDKWTEATMRRLIRKAADEGYDYIAWTPGFIQKGRWNEEGLVPFYDKMLPKATEKVAKKLDKEAKVETIEIQIVPESVGDPQRTKALRITDKLKTMAKEGQPLFAVPAAAGVGAALKPKEESNGDT